jgi:hypothetical protein
MPSRGKRDTRRDQRRHRRREARRRLLATLAILAVLGTVVGVVLLVVGGSGGQGVRTGALGRATATTVGPPVTTTLVRSPDQLRPPPSAAATAAVLERVERGIRGDDRTLEHLAVLGWEQQLAYRQLSNHPDWVPAVLDAMPADLRGVVQANVEAGAALSALTPAQSSLPDWTIVTPPPPDTLRGYYAEAERVSGIPWVYLAAIHFLETRMGRIRGNSTAGAQGPMQFIPSTWAAYGNGGDINDNRDAILAAGRYLRAAGGPSNMDKALYAYNHDTGYVAAVKAYASVMAADSRAYDGYYFWQVYYRTTGGTVLLPEGYGPGSGVTARSLPPS